MKIKIVTFYWSNNLGALIQSLSLREYLQLNFGYETSFNDYLPKKLILRERMSQISKANSKYIFQLILKKINLYKWKKNIAFLDPPTQKKTFDKEFYIYGSDEIWNFTNPFFGYDPFYFGENNSNIKIAYAASIGNSDFNKKKEDYHEIVQYLRKFKAISVRDQASSNFIQKLINIKPHIVLDPCFLSLPKIFEGKISKKYQKFGEQKYFLIYGDYFKNDQIRLIQNFCKIKKIKIISAGYINNWADKNLIDVTPNDLIFFIKNAYQIATSMFHGVMLSYKFKKQFWISEDPYRKNKLEYFINKLDLKERYMDYFGKNELDYEINNAVFEEWLKFSKNFLNEEIN